MLKCEVDFEIVLKHHQTLKPKGENYSKTKTRKRKVTKFTIAICKNTSYFKSIAVKIKGIGSRNFLPYKLASMAIRVIKKRERKLIFFSTHKMKWCQKFTINQKNLCIESTEKNACPISNGNILEVVPHAHHCPHFFVGSFFLISYKSMIFFWYIFLRISEFSSNNNT